MKILTASLVVYKNKLSLLEAVLNSLPTENFVLVVADNSPTESLRSFFCSKKNVIYIYLNSNLGFGKGHNIAFERIRNISEFHFIINPDIYCDSSVFIKIANFMRDNDDIGILGPKIYYPNAQIQFSCRLLPTPLDLILRRIPVKKLQEKHAVKNELRFTDYKSTMEVPFLLGCFLCIKGELYEKINGFDPRYFMYLEDIDICRKVNLTHKVLYYPHVHIYHHYAKESKTNLRLFIAHLNSSFLYFMKWGWFWDSDRKIVNTKVLNDHNYH
ncbi:hypothetical protein LX69_00826 [Breznakibacter xylanolyticus]|uniref:Glycosyltransferase 2-like domain-containing protein n=1 Tax=Breznakibacter xylanolyticus TaxID=990 RepID=A0A2W7QBM7_9BACT|nr:glycosyltransferase [Breznakibacter xylanolyticus]PZX19159.1 hypothetical protein LX69_00826 [Breznakibacter xylanolyticus]